MRVSHDRTYGFRIRYSPKETTLKAVRVVSFGGQYRTRTCGLLNVNQAL